MFEVIEDTLSTRFYQKYTLVSASTLACIILFVFFRKIVRILNIFGEQKESSYLINEASNK